MTFSLVARCHRTGQFGIAVASSSPAVAARCAHVRPGVGVAASQNVTDPLLGPAALDLLAGGAAPQAVLDQLGARPHFAHRQMMVLGATGPAAVWSGSRTLGVHGAALGEDCAAAGNMLAHDGVPAAMVAGFEAARARSPGAELGAAILAALQAGLAAGGEAGPVHSAGLLVAGAQPWPLADLRVDWDDADPVERLHALWSIWAPQMHTYVQRALNPEAAPSFGVAGDS